MKKYISFVLLLLLMACQDDSSSVSPADTPEPVSSVVQEIQSSSDEGKKVSSSKGSSFDELSQSVEESSSSVVKSSSSNECGACEKGVVVQVEYPEELGEKPQQDSSLKAGAMGSPSEQYGIDGLSFDSRVLDSIPLYGNPVREYIVSAKIDRSSYGPIMVEVPDSLVGYVFPNEEDLFARNTERDCKYFVLVLSVGQQPFVHVLTKVSKDTIDIANIERSPRDGFMCRYSTAMVSAGYLLEFCGDDGVPEKDFVVRWVTIESPLWGCSDRSSTLPSLGNAEK